MRSFGGYDGGNALSAGPFVPAGREGCSEPLHWLVIVILKPGTSSGQNRINRSNAYGQLRYFLLR